MRFWSDRSTVTSFLLLTAGYLVMSYSFMQLRVPPTGFGIPLGELMLVAVLCTTDLPRVMIRIGSTVVIFPFIVWWVEGFGRLVIDCIENGYWAFRDSTQLIESLFLVVGFVIAGKQDAIRRLMHWLPRIIGIACLYSLLFPYADQIAEWSPKLSGGSEQAIPIFGSFATTGTMLLLGAYYCLMHPAASVKFRYPAVAGFLVCFALVILQARTTYLQIATLVILLAFVRPRTLARMSVALPILAVALAVIAAFELRISGRLTANISFSFFIEHFQSMVGIGAANDAGLSEAAEGVPLRMGWWRRLYTLLTHDPATLLVGLGYGIPLTDFSDSLGVTTREPHNSLISVVGRQGLIGLVAWLWMQIELFRAGFSSFLLCRRLHLRGQAAFILLLITFALLTLAGCLGEDIMEKPYNAIPYYAFWGFVLRIAYQLRVQRSAASRAPTLTPLRASVPGDAR